MTQREVTAEDNTTWTCVQAYAAVNSAATDKATELSQDEAGNVPVVCTPRGGAQTVRLELSKNWLENLTDAELLQEIKKHQS